MGLNQSNCWLTHIIYVDFVIAKGGKMLLSACRGKGQSLPVVASRQIT